MARIVAVVLVTAAALLNLVAAYGADGRITTAVYSSPEGSTVTATPVHWGHVSGYAYYGGYPYYYAPYTAYYAPYYGYAAYPYYAPYYSYAYYAPYVASPYYTSYSAWYPSSCGCGY